MAFSDDLLRQAEHLATRDRRRPQQANLRRAVSSAYYSVFHLLISDATAQVLGTHPSRMRFRQVLARGFDHGAMYGACKAIGGGTLPQAITSIAGTLVISPELREVARGFVLLQQMRHRADYDLSAPFLRTDVHALLERARSATGTWKRIRRSDEACFFLGLLPIWKQIVSRA